jgi:hypothetical protein
MKMASVPSEVEGRTAMIATKVRVSPSLDMDELRATKQDKR